MRTVAGTVPSDYGQIWNTAVIHHALDAGINFIDTTDVYSHGGATRAAGSSRGAEQSAALGHRLDRPVSGAPPPMRTPRWMRSSQR
jgi:hypothetical protein